MEAKAGGLSAQRTVLMMLLFWSLQPPTPIPDWGGGVEGGKRRGQGLVFRQERSNVPCNSKILYLGSPQRSRVLIF